MYTKTILHWLWEVPDDLIGHSYFSDLKNKQHICSHANRRVRDRGKEQQILEDHRTPFPVYELWVWIFNQLLLSHFSSFCNVFSSVFTKKKPEEGKSQPKMYKRCSCVWVLSHHSKSPCFNLGSTETWAYIQLWISQLDPLSERGLHKNP